MTTDPILQPPHGGEGPSYARPRESWRGEIAATLALAWPLVLANLAQMAVHAIDVIFVARLGDEALAAASLSISLFGLVLWSLTGMAGMVAALIAAELGRRKHAVREVRRSARMGMWVAIAFGMVATIPCVFGEELMLATGQDPKISHLAGQFLHILLFANVPMLLSAVLRNFVSALGRPIFATMITVLAIGVSALGNYAFVFGHFGFPAMGLLGSATSSVVVSCFILASYVVAISTDRRLRRYRVFGNFWRPEWSRLRELITKGAPVTATILAEAALFSSAAFFIGRIDPVQLAAHALALQLAAMAFQVPMGVSQATTIRVGYFYGARDPGAIGRAGWTGLVIGSGFMLFTAALMLFAPRAILRLYIDPDSAAEAAVAAFAVRFMLVGAAFQLFDGIQVVAAGALRGLQDTRVPMWLAMFGYWIPGFGCSIWLGFFTPLEGMGVWIGFAAGLFTVAVLMTWRWAARARLGLLPS